MSGTAVLTHEEVSRSCRMHSECGSASELLDLVLEVDGSEDMESSFFRSSSLICGHSCQYVQAFCD